QSAPATCRGRAPLRETPVGWPGGDPPGRSRGRRAVRRAAPRGVSGARPPKSGLRRPLHRAGHAAHRGSCRYRLCFVDFRRAECTIDVSVRSGPSGPSMTPTETLILASYFFVLLILAVYGWHRYYLVYLYMKHRDEQPVPAGQFENLPPVTI